jgi:hyperosmotically inducible protein
MKTTSPIISSLAGIALLIGFAGIATAQSASSDFHSAGSETKSAGSSLGHAVVNAAQGTATATEDSTTTGKVKWALHENRITKDKNIHVSTTDGFVTLNGAVPTEEVAREATVIAERTKGVKGVHNELRVSSARADE